MDEKTGMLYKLVRPLLFRLEPERAHRLTLAILSRFPPLQRAPDPPELQVGAFGVTFSNPLGLAAGMDKDGRALAAWNAFGFGFAEVGTVTPRPQPGNAKPRMWRLEGHQALINRLGFPSEGIARVAPRIARARQRRSPIRIGINLGPNKDTPTDLVAEDYAALAEQAGGLADFLVINVSSPNTPSLRDFQAPERVRAIIAAIRGATAARLPPILLKIAPDLADSLVDDLTDTAIELELAGIVATNTTLRRSELGVISGLQGGLSGLPLATLARGIISRVYRRSRGRLVIIGVGGVASAADAYAHLAAGANLIELYTSLIYRGPGLVRVIKRGLLDLLARDGMRSITDVVGRAAGD